MTEPIPMRLPCPGTVPDGYGGLKPCGVLHIDEGEFRTKPHHTHSCQACGMTWRPAVVHTVGVDFLPGFKNDSIEPAPRPPWPPEGCWLWTSHRDNERWSGPETTREACIAEAMDHGYETFYVAEGHRIDGLDIERAVDLQLDLILEQVNSYLIDNNLYDPDGDYSASFKDEKAAGAALGAWAIEHIDFDCSWAMVLQETIQAIEPPTVGDLWFDTSERARADVFAVSERLVQYFRTSFGSEAPKRFSMPTHEWPVAYQLVAHHGARIRSPHTCFVGEAETLPQPCLVCDQLIEALLAPPDAGQ